jgi:hypothetical protein
MVISRSLTAYLLRWDQPWPTNPKEQLGLAGINCCPKAKNKDFSHLDFGCGFTDIQIIHFTLVYVQVLYFNCTSKENEPWCWLLLIIMWSRKNFSTSNKSFGITIKWGEVAHMVKSWTLITGYFDFCEVPSIESTVQHKAHKPGREVWGP